MGPCLLHATPGVPYVQQPPSLHETSDLVPTPPPKGTLSYCTWAQDAANTKGQKENWLVNGLKHHRYLSVTRGTYRCQWAEHKHAQ